MKNLTLKDLKPLSKGDTLLESITRALQSDSKRSNPLMRQDILDDHIKALQDNTESNKQRVEQMKRLGYTTHETMELLF